MVDNTCWKWLLNNYYHSIFLDILSKDDLLAFNKFLKLPYGSYGPNSPKCFADLLTLVVEKKCKRIFRKYHHLYPFKNRDERKRIKRDFF